MSCSHSPSQHVTIEEDPFVPTNMDLAGFWDMVHIQVSLAGNINVNVINVFIGKLQITIIIVISTTIIIDVVILLSAHIIIITIFKNLPSSSS